MKTYLLGYRNLDCKLYKPKMNKKKVWGFLAFVVVCIVTPCTNWMIPLAMKGISKINPLWFYQ